MMEIEFVKITKYIFMLNICISWLYYFIYCIFSLKIPSSSLFLLEYCKKKENIANIQGGISPTVKQCLALFVYTLLKHNELK